MVGIALHVQFFILYNNLYKSLLLEKRAMINL